MRSSQKLFPREASADQCMLSALENFVTFSGKPDWLSPFLLMHWSCSQHFYLRKGGFPNREAVGQSCSLKKGVLKNFEKIDKKTPVPEFLFK